MAIWSSPELEAMLGGPLDNSGLIAAALDRLIADGVREGSQIDFKSRYAPSIIDDAVGDASDPGGRAWEFAKDVAAFANHQGGLILLGVRDKDEVAEKIVGLTGITLEGEQRRLRQQLQNRVVPALTIEFVPIVTDHGPCMAVVVPPSVRAPHAVLTSPVSKQPRPMVYPERNGSDTRYLSEPEIADRYLRRAATTRAIEQRAQDIATEGCDALDRASEGIWVYLAVVPERPVTSRLDGPQMFATRGWIYQLQQPLSPLSTIGVNDSAPTAAPGRVIFTDSAPAAPISDNFGHPNRFWLELYTDGSVFAALDCELAPTGQRQNPTNTAAITYLNLVDTVMMLTSVSTQWAANQTGAWGNAATLAGLHDPNRDWSQPNKKPLMRPVELRSTTSFDVISRMPGTRHLSRPASSLLRLDLAKSASGIGRVGLAYDVVSVLLQWFGVADTRLITSDGQIRLQGWGSARNKKSVLAWAQDHQVPVRNDAYQKNAGSSQS